MQISNLGFAVYPFTLLIAPLMLNEEAEHGLVDLELMDRKKG